MSAFAGHTSGLEIHAAANLALELIQTSDELEGFCHSKGISPEYLDTILNSWCGRPAEELRFFASELYSRQQVRGQDLFSVSAHDEIHGSVPVIFSRMDEQVYLSRFEINLGTVETALGSANIAGTADAVVYMSFGNAGLAENELRGMFPEVQISEGRCGWEEAVVNLIANPFLIHVPIPVATRCTPFQELVFRNLLYTLPGSFTTYGELALATGDRNAARAVGSALASNPVAWLIPCHRVVNANGSYGHFRWGPARKKLFLAWEAACLHRQ